MKQSNKGSLQSLETTCKPQMLNEIQPKSCISVLYFSAVKWGHFGNISFLQENGAEMFIKAHSVGVNVSCIIPCIFIMYKTH